MAIPAGSPAAPRLFPSDGARYAIRANGDRAKSATAEYFMEGPAGQWLPCEMYAYDGTDTPSALISPSVLLLDSYGGQVDFWGPADGRTRVWMSIDGGPLVPVEANHRHRLDEAELAAVALAAEVADLQPGGDGDAALVHRTGNEPIGGVKTFADSPIVPTPTTGSQASPKSYVDNATADRVVLPTPTGTDDTSALNALLAAASGRLVSGRPGVSYQISAPLVVHSGTTLDMTGCTVTLKTGSNCNILVNRALSQVRRFIDAATTSASQAITSATAAFVSGDVGKTIVVHGAGAAGALLITTITAVTNGTTATMAAAAGTTTSGTYAAVGPRDSNITVVGGTWVRTTGNGGASSGWDRHNLRLRHIDGLVLRDLSVQTVSEKYAISIGDVTNTRIRDITFSVGSDGVHVQGPASRIRISGITGTTVDDSVAITPRDWTAYDDVFGDVTDVLVENVMTTSTAACVFKVLGGSTATASRRIRVRGLHGAGNNNAIIIGDDTAQPNTTGGLVDEVSLRDVSCVAQNNQSIAYINGANIRRLSINGVTCENAAATAPIIRVVPLNAATIASLIISDIDVSAMNANAIVQVDSNATITRMILDRVTVASSASGAVGVAVSGSITDLTVGRITGTLTGSSYVVSLTGGSATASIARLSLSDIHVTGSGGGLITAQTSTHTLPRVEMANILLNATAWLVDLNTITELHMANVATISPTAGMFNIRAAAALTIRGAGLNLAPGGQNINITAGGTVTSKTFALECDIDDLQLTANSMAFNTNAAKACGVGPVVSNGTLWKHLYTGTTT